MKVHEYQAKALFAQYHLPVDKSVLCRTVDEAEKSIRYQLIHSLACPIISQERLLFVFSMTKR